MFAPRARGFSPFYDPHDQRQRSLPRERVGFPILGAYVTYRLWFAPRARGFPHGIRWDIRWDIRWPAVCPASAGVFLFFT